MSGIPQKIYSLATYFWFASGAALMLLTPLAVTIILNRAGAPQDVGLYAFAYAVTAPMQAFFGIHARTFIAMDRLHGYGARDVTAQRLYMAAGLFAGAAVVTGLRGFGAEEVAIFAAMCLIRVAEGQSEVTAGLMQRHHAPKLIAAAYGTRAVLAIVAFAALIHAGVGLAAALTAMAVVSFAVFALFDRPVLARLGEPLTWRGIAQSAASRRPLRLFRHLAPAGLVLLFAVAESNLPRFFVEEMVGLVELGIFASLGFALAAVTNLVHPVFQMTIAPLGQWVARNDPQAARQVRRIVVVNIAITATAGLLLLGAVTTIGVEAVSLVFGAAYGAHGALLLALGVAAAIGMVRSCVGFILTGLDAIRVQSVLSGCNMALFATLALTGAVGAGVVGIAWTWVAATATTTTAGLAIMAVRLHLLKRDVAPAAGLQRA